MIVFDRPDNYPNCYPNRVNADGIAVGRCTNTGESVAVRWDLADAVIVLSERGEAVDINDSVAALGWSAAAVTPPHSGTTPARACCAP